MLRRRKIAARDRKSRLRQFRSSCEPPVNRSAPKHCSAKDPAANRKPTQGRGGARKRRTASRSAHSADGYSSGQRRAKRSSLGVASTDSDTSAAQPTNARARRLCQESDISYNVKSLAGIDLVSNWSHSLQNFISRASDCAGLATARLARIPCEPVPNKAFA